LVVDDDESMRATLMAYISRMGVQVRAVADVAEARRTLQAEPVPFDIVLTDLRLPDGSGLDIVKAARSRNSASLVTIITGFASLETAIEAIRLGAHDYVTKPFSLDQIGITVRNMVGHVTLARENARLSLRLQELLGEVSRLRDERLDLGKVLEAIRLELAENSRRLDYLIDDRTPATSRAAPADAAERMATLQPVWKPADSPVGRPVRGYREVPTSAPNRRGSV